MARVTIDGSAYAGAKKLAIRMGWTVREAVGALVFFWGDSQDLEQTICAEEDIAIWFDAKPNQVTQLIEALLWSGFIVKESGSNSYYIVGNTKHIEEQINGAD